MTSVRMVIFDMGGVLVELGPISELIGGDEVPADDFWDRWLSSDAVREFESGKCSVEEFGDRAVADLGLSGSGASFVERFRTWPKGLFEGAEALIADIQEDVEVAVLSNTNALHWETQVDHERVQGLFGQTFLSYELGLAKPDTEIFEAVLAQIDIDAEHVVFLDDNQINVDGARQVGIDAALTKGVDAARAALAERGLL